MKGRFLFRVMPTARGFLLREGTDLRYGARHLKRAIERHLVYPLASMLATEQVGLGDVVSIDWDGSDAGLKFSKEARVASAREARSTSRVSAEGASYCSWPGRLLPTELAMAEHRL